MKKLEYIWISRDKHDRSTHVDVWGAEPSLAGGQWHTPVYKHDLAVTEYECARAIFGITLRPGQCKKIRIEVTE